MVGVISVSCVLLAVLGSVAGSLGSAGEDQLIIPDVLATKLAREAEEWHWTPWQAARTFRNGNILVEKECTPGSSVDSYPDGWLTDEQLLYGGVILYLFFGFYAFIMLAKVCSGYFIPCVELICEDLNIPENIAAATFMSVATSCPEFFVNTISTFVSESDMGIGTIVGSALFNALGVAAVGSLAATQAIQLEPHAVTRDVLIYMLNASILVAIVWDGYITWYEATCLAVLYFVYFLFIFNSDRLFRFVHRSWRKTRGVDISATTGKDNEAYDKTPEIRIDGVKEVEKRSDPVGAEKSEEETKATTRDDPLRLPLELGLFGRCWWAFTWPLKLLLTLTIPSPQRHRKFYPLAFIMCIAWIGANSYIVSWTMTVFGTTFMIPDSVMGMTFLAFGGCLPEAVSIYIMSRRGEGGIGVSNALGANTLAILFALGLPWFIRCMVFLGQGVDSRILINSTGIQYIIILLFLAVCTLWVVLRLSSFKLRRSIGFVLAFVYLVFITIAILIEMDVILPGADEPSC